jgi:hypothetical protein
MQQNIIMTVVCVAYVICQKKKFVLVKGTPSGMPYEESYETHFRFHISTHILFHVL